MRRRIVDAWDKVRDGRSGALPMHALRRKAARQDHQDAGWDPLLSALEQGKARNLQSLNIAVRPGDVHWRPRLTCASACRLGTSLLFISSLLHLVLSGNEIGTAGALALADGLQHTPHLHFSLPLLPLLVIIASPSSWPPMPSTDTNFLILLYQQLFSNRSYRYTLGFFLGQPYCPPA